MWNNKGISMVEILVSLCVFLLILSTLIPVIYQLKMAEYELKLKRSIQSELHDRIILSDFPVPSNNRAVIFHTNVDFEFKIENRLVKGCAYWKSEKQSTESFCLYNIARE
ncbi:hypothetical protein [Sediminibacillus massiliensis]|uniref:hypothetical protein n=1 Tax=Sediminibacillus massiliensis TaxID=1926277 RepID=UPI0009884BD7|nr:hypothetical protein [Sediminibacillus massiliensis]